MSDDIVTWKQYVDTRFESQDKAVQAALVAVSEAVKKSESAYDERFRGVNEFRKTLSDQTSNFITRDEYNAAHQGLIDKTDGVILRIAAQEGSNKGSELTKGNIVAYLTVAVAIITVIVIWANRR